MASSRNDREPKKPSEFIEAIHYLQNTLSLLKRSLEFDSWEAQQTIDAMILEKNTYSHDDFEKAFSELNDRKQSVIDELRGVINLASNYDQETQAYRKLIITLECGDYAPMLAEGIFDAKVALDQLGDAIASPQQPSKKDYTASQLEDAILEVIKADESQYRTAEFIATKINLSYPGKKTSATKVGEHPIHKQHVQTWGKSRASRNTSSAARDAALEALIRDQSRNNAADQGRRIKGRRVAGTD